MISSGQYNCYLQEIAGFKAMPQPLSQANQMMLDMMENEVQKFESANPDKVGKEKGLSQAINFAMDVHIAMQKKGVCIQDRDSLREILSVVLPKYPGHIVSDGITFPDGSVATLTPEGIGVR